ncbi:MAG: 50S ribosomal protein L13 [Phycisphaerae bacterium]|nr:50S ribosomal protein L13 [Phycisphaerae bacterium]
MARNTGKSYLAKPGEIEGQWHLIDATDKILGRMATRIATILMGKHKPTYTPHTLTGDFVVIVNAEKVKLTGRKTEMKTYERYTYYPGGRKVIPFTTMHAKHPDDVIRVAVRRMLPKNRLGRQMLSRLKIYAGAEHNHQAQRPEPLAI